MDIVARIVFFAFGYPYQSIGLFLLLVVGILMGKKFGVRHRNKQGQRRQVQAPPVQEDNEAETAGRSPSWQEWAWRSLGIIAILGLWMTWLFLPSWLIPGTPAATLVLYAQNRLGYWLLRLAPLAAVVFLVREGWQYRSNARLAEWGKGLIGTAGVALAVHALLCLGSVVLAITPLMGFVLPPAGGGHNSFFAPFFNAMAWPFYVFLLAVPLSVALTIIFRTIFSARQQGPAVNLALAATLALLLPIWLVTGGYAKGVNARDKEGVTALMAAAETGHLPGVRGLIRAGADVNARSRAYPPYAGTTVFGFAVGRPEIVLALLENGARPESNALLWAVREKNDNLVEALLRAGVDPNVGASQGQTALIMATQEKQDTLVATLIRAGADANARDPHGRTPLIIALQQKHDTLVPALIRAGADPNNGRDTNGRTALIMAIQQKQDTLVPALLQAGADPNARDPHGETALILAAQASDFERAAAGIVRQLIMAGADVNARDSIGRTALMMKSPEEVTRALLEAGADPMLKDAQGWNALARYGSLDTSASAVLLRQAMEATDPAGQRNRN